jgi:hypothetical protein
VAPPPPPTCTDGIKDGCETDVDCGGPTCPACPNGGGCAQNSDCQSGDCQSGVCMAPPCKSSTYVTHDDDRSAEQIQSVDVGSFTVSPSYSQIEGSATGQNKPGTVAHTVYIIDNGGSGDIFYITVGDGQ